MGLDDLVQGKPQVSRGEPGRTHKLTRIVKFEHIERNADEISKLLIPDDRQRDTQRTLYYVIVELLRNALQHSRDKLGGVIAAQRNDRGRNWNKPVIQVAVADTGIGILEHLKTSHPQLQDAQEALDKALWPHVSGTFEFGLTGTAENAGMGLFFIAEMAKLTAGTLVLASRGATLLLDGDPEFEGHHRLEFVQPRGTGYPGTLVAFELPTDAVEDYNALIERIRELARERTPRRATHRWMRYEPPPADAQEFLVNVGVEDTKKAMQVATETLIPWLVQRRTIVLNFRGMEICTQSYLHALLFEPLRMAWALRIPIYVSNVQPGVRSNLELLENYALGG
ncbi:hypothetical protein DB31_1199 [Hyalangium minutum]|uniref:Histidine kinase/HSP90-like ATPase domain-containing protein n=1 Tax=Hyalangium minutum TaxID=394096 RepID=A0A085WEM1_9BACT|nr:hypothetical protein DB31_1199 [Hyalangium minutum]